MILLLGRQRMFGSISFGVASSLVGFITDWTNDMNAIFYVYAISAVCFIMVAGSTQFKTEKIDTQRGQLLLRPPQFKPSFNRTIAAPRPSPSSSSSTQQKQQRKRIKQFQLDYDAYEDDDLFTDGMEDDMQMRQNEIQRLIQFATESSIIEAVNLSNPPASRRRYSNVTGTDMDEVANAINARTPTNVIELLRDPRVLLFFLTMMLMGASLNMVVSFLFIFLKQDLGASSSVVGLTGLVGSVTELLFFFYSRDVSNGGR